MARANPIQSTNLERFADSYMHASSAKPVKSWPNRIQVLRAAVVSKVYVFHVDNYVDHV